MKSLRDKVFESQALGKDVEKDVFQMNHGKRLFGLPKCPQRAAPGKGFQGCCCNSDYRLRFCNLHHKPVVY